MIKTLRNLLKQDKERFVVPRGVQDVIPIKAIYDDGIFQVGRDKFSNLFKGLSFIFRTAICDHNSGKLVYCPLFRSNANSNSFA